MRHATDFDAVGLSSGVVVVRLEYVDSKRQAAEVAAHTAAPSALQVGLSLAQADKLIELLTNRVNKIRKSTSQSGALN